MSRSLAVAAALLVATAAVPSSACADEWQALGLSGQIVRKLRVRDGRLYAVTMAGLYVKAAVPADSQWTLAGFPGEWLVDAAAISPDTLFACKRHITGVGEDTTYLWRSIDAGASWHPFQRGLRRSFDGVPGQVRVLAAFGSPVGALFGVGEQIEKSTDGGVTWRAVGPPILSNFLVQSPWAQVTLWAGGENTAMMPELLRSTDGGGTWVEVPILTPGESACVSLAFDPADPDVLITGMERYVMRSADSGSTWATLPGLDPEVRYWAVATGTGAPRHLYVGGEGPPVGPPALRLHRSDDDGLSWTTLEHPSSDAAIWSLVAAPWGPRDSLWLGTGNGVYRYISDALASAPMEDLAPARAWLSNHPNPLRGWTTIELGLPRAGEVALRILDLHGRVVDTPARGVWPQGIHRVSWTPRGLSPGLYLAELRAAGTVVRRKLCVVR